MKILKYFVKLLFLSSVLLLGYSCAKQEAVEEKEIVPEGKSLVKFGLLNSTEEEVFIGDKQAKISNSGNDTQAGVVNLGNGISVEYELSPENSTSQVNSLNVSNKITSVNKLKAAAVKRELATNVKYRILVYNTDTKALVINRQYNYKAEKPEFLLDAGLNYTFIVYSVNSTSTLPTVSGENNLNTAVIESNSDDLMFVKEEVKNLSYGVSYLTITMNRQFSEVKVKLVKDASVLGNFVQAPTLNFNLNYSSASLKFSNGALTYNSLKNDGQNTPIINFLSATNILETNYVRIIHPSSTNGILRVLSNVKIGDEEISPFEIKGINLKPGLRYNLTITFKTCVSVKEELLYEKKHEAGPDGGAYDNGVFKAKGQEILSQNFAAGPSDYGFRFDIYSLDNSMFLYVNGQSISLREIQFQQYNSNTPPNTPDINVRFADGTIYGVGATQTYLYTVNPSSGQNPIIRVHISKKGEVSMEGRKSQSNQTLYPLVLTNGNSFNKVTWNDKGNNVLRVMQRIDGLTHITIVGRGVNKISCNNK